MTVGPWKAIRLHTYDVSVQDVDIRSAVSPELDVNLTVTVNVQSDPSLQISNYSLKATLKNPDGTVRLEGANVRFSDSASAQSEFHLSSSESLELWYPVGYGKQPIYSVEVEVSDLVRTPVSRFCNSIPDSTIQARQCDLLGEQEDFVPQG